MVQDPFFVLQSVVHFVSDVGGVDHEIARVQTIRRNHDHRVVGGANGFYAAHVRTFLDGKEEEEEEDLYFPGFLCSCILLLSPFTVLSPFTDTVVFSHSSPSQDQHVARPVAVDVVQNGQTIDRQNLCAGGGSFHDLSDPVFDSIVHRHFNPGHFADRVKNCD